MKDILIIVPSYRRQDKIADCVKAWRETTSGNSDFLLVLEEADQEYPHLEGIKVMKGVFGNVGKAMNEAFRAHPGYKFYAHINDDHHLKTKGWEEKVIEALKDGGYAYGNDLLQGENLATAVVMSADIPEKLGYMALPQLTHLYIDDYWMEMGKAIGKLYYLPEVVIEHMHPANGKGKMDENYARVNSEYPKWLSIFEEWKRTKPDLEKLK